MCRNTRPLHNFAPPATEEEVRDAASVSRAGVAGRACIDATSAS